MQTTKRRDATAEVRESLCAIMEKHRDEDLTRREVTALLVQDGGICRDWIEAIREQAVDREVGRILRSSTFTTAGGEIVRTFQCYRVYVQSEDGREVQRTFWRSIDTMNRDQMLGAYTARVAHAREAKEKADADLRYWNEQVAPKLGAKRIRPE